jgi:formylglycine-generating enzyme required for sulfatase activity
MSDHNRIGRWPGVFAVAFVMAICITAKPVVASEPADDGPAVAYTSNSLGMQFATIPPGQFPMGCSEGVKPVECSSEEKPRHTVQITKGFEIGKTEVTQKEWQMVMDSNPSHFKGPDLPVEMVTFQDVQAFLAKMNARNDGYLYRLPTEAEWEYAARAGNADQFGGAKVANSLARYAPPDDWAWYNVENTNPVAVRKANAWGLYDIRGNVNEWVQDWYNPKYYASSPMADPKGPDSEVNDGGRGVRGGSFHDDGPWLTRVSLRQHFPVDYSHFDLGFRVVREKR